MRTSTTSARPARSISTTTAIREGVYDVYRIENADFSPIRQVDVTEVEIIEQRTKIRTPKRPGRKPQPVLGQREPPAFLVA